MSPLSVAQLGLNRMNLFFLSSETMFCFVSKIEYKSLISDIKMINKIDELYEVFQWIGEKHFIRKKNQKSYSVDYSWQKIQKISVNN